MYLQRALHHFRLLRENRPFTHNSNGVLPSFLPVCRHLRLERRLANTVWLNVCWIYAKKPVYFQQFLVNSAHKYFLHTGKQNKVIFIYVSRRYIAKSGLIDTRLHSNRRPPLWRHIFYYCSKNFFRLVSEARPWRRNNFPCVGTISTKIWVRGWTHCSKVKN